MATLNIFYRLLKKTGLTSRGLARALGFSENAIIYYKNSKRKPSYNNCIKIIKFAKKYDMKITLEDLLFDE